MKNIIAMFGICVIVVLAVGAVNAQDNDSYSTTSLTIGSEYLDYSDYTKKIGEYRHGEDEWVPEIGLNVLSKSGNTLFRLDGHYHDEANIFGRVHAKVGNRFNLKTQYRSLIHQEGQDMLTEMEAREFFESTGLPGGKMTTHEILDPGADYNYRRQEILTEVQVLLSQEHNIRLSAAHRTILKNGEEQAISSNHCFSCHLTSDGRDVQQRQHQIEAGIDAEVGQVDLGYRFGYRIFESTAPDATAYYDPAKHPTLGTAAAEFASRLIYQDTTIAFSTYPKTEKMSHKVRFKSKVGQGQLSSSLGYSRAENRGTELATDAIVGAVNYAVNLNERTRLVAKGTAARMAGDDLFIDLPTYRDGAADLNEVSFDYTRYSTIDRWDGRISAELIHRLNPKMTLYVLGGFNRVDRDDYATVGDGTVTSTIIGQAKLRYRKGLTYSAFLKYRFEKISDPFVSARGLFERDGSLELEPLVPTSTWIFYFQREDLRYQDITSLPTQKHVFEWNSSYRPNARVNLNLGVKGQYDKNGDLDSLDVQHFALQPNLNLNYTPDGKWTLAAGYTYMYDKSKLPIAVAMFDG